MLTQTLSRPPSPHAADLGFADQAAVIEHLNRYPEVTLTDAQGRRYLVLGQPLGADPALALPFQVVPERHGSTWRVRVQPGSIVETWASATALFPTVRGVPNTVHHPVYLRPDAGWHVLTARVELSPLAQEVEPGYWEATGAETVAGWDLDFHEDTEDARLMQVNPATGAVLQTGIYYRPVAEVTLTGEDTPREALQVAQHALGPWTVKVCGSSLIVLPGPVVLSA